MAGAWWVAARSRSTRWRGIVKQRTSTRFLPCCGSSRLQNQPNASRVPVYRRTYCCAAALLSYCSGLVGGWRGCTRVGRTCGIVRGCVFVPVGNCPVVSFFYTYHIIFNIKLPRLISLLYWCFPVFLDRGAGAQFSKTNQMLLAYRYTTVHTGALLYCCIGLVGGGWVVRVHVGG